VVDQVNGYAADLSALTRAGRTVYRRPGVMVFDLRRGVGEPILQPPCGLFRRKDDVVGG
jgi:hypothetical protein